MSNEFDYLGRRYDGSEIISGTVSKSQSLDMAELPVDTLSLTIRPKTSRDFLTNEPLPFLTKDHLRFESAERDVFSGGFLQSDPLEQYIDGSKTATWFLNSIEKAASQVSYGGEDHGDNIYKINAVSSLGRLLQRVHYGNVYSGTSDPYNLAENIIADICGDAPVTVDPVFQNVRMYGWLPIASARDNLQQVLFALNANLTTDPSGTLRVENLSDQPTDLVDVQDIYNGTSAVKNDAPITKVFVTEHSYSPGLTEQVLFSGRTVAETIITPKGVTVSGQLIKFDGPASGVSATGFSLLEVGANYAVVSQAENGTLSGYPYIHATREIQRTVSTRAGLKAHIATLEGKSTVSVTAGNAYYVSVAMPGFVGYLSFSFGSSFSVSNANITAKLWVDKAGQVYSASASIGEHPPSFSSYSTSATRPSGTEIIVSNSRVSVIDVEKNENITVANVKSITNATLVGATAVADVADRLAECYRHRKKIKAAVAQKTIMPGESIEIFNAESNSDESACVESLSMSLSGINKSQISTLAGFSPWQQVEFTDIHVVLTESQTYVFPADMPDGTQVQVTVIGGGNGGTRGKNGNGTSGGEAGEGGQGGKIRRETITCNHSQSVVCTIGTGGVANGGVGSATSFWTVSSANGEHIDTGYYDAIDQITYGAKGADGFPGSNGGAGGKAAEDLYKSWTPGKKGSDAADVGAGASVGGAGCDGFTSASHIENKFHWSIGGHGGGGAAFGGNGGDATKANDNVVFASGGKTGNGGNAVDATAAANYGCGGNGGHGGGGCGARGSTRNGDQSAPSIQDGAPGAGSSGSAGASGVVILFYRMPA